MLVEGDPNRLLQMIFGVNVGSKNVKLDDVVKEGLEVQKAVYSTGFDNLSLIFSGFLWRDTSRWVLLVLRKSSWM